MKKVIKNKRTYKSLKSKKSRNNSYAKYTKKEEWVKEYIKQFGTEPSFF